MAQKLYTESNFHDIAEAIRTKGVSGTFKVGQMGDAVRSIVASSDITNGVIEQYKAYSLPIEADNFVEKVLGTIVDATGAIDADTTIVGPETIEDEGTTRAWGYNSIVTFDDGKCFLIHGIDDYLYGMVLIPNGEELIYDSTQDIELASHTAGDYTAYGSSAVALPLLRANIDSYYPAFVTFARNGELHATLVLLSSSAEDTTLSIPGGEAVLSQATDATDDVHSVLVDDGHVFVIHRNGNYLEGLLVSVNIQQVGAVVNRTTLSSLVGSYGNASLTLCANNRVFVTYQAHSDHCIYGLYCDINPVAETVTVHEADTLIANNAGWPYISTTTTKLAENKVLAAYVVEGATNDCVGKVVSIGQGGLSIGNATDLATDIGHQYFAIPRLQDDKAMIFYTAHDTYQHLYSALLSVSGSTITVSSDGIFDSTTRYVRQAVAVLSPRGLVAAYGSEPANPNNRDLFASAITPPTVIDYPRTKIDGLTKTQCTRATAGDVWLLDTNQSS